MSVRRGASSQGVARRSIPAPLPCPRWGGRGPRRGGGEERPPRKGGEGGDGERRSGGPGGEGEPGRKTRLQREILCALQLLVWIETRWCAGTPACSGGGGAKHMVNG